MPFDKQKGGERTDGKGSEVKFVRLDLAQQLAINCDVLKFLTAEHTENTEAPEKTNNN